MSDRPLEIYQQIPVADREKLKTTQLAILDMVRAKIEEGQVASLAFLLVGPDPKQTYTGR